MAKKEDVKSIEGVYAMNEVPDRPHPFCGCRLEPMSYEELGLISSGRVQTSAPSPDVARSHLKSGVPTHPDNYTPPEPAVNDLRSSSVLKQTGDRAGVVESALAQVPPEHVRNLTVNLVDDIDDAPAVFFEREQTAVVGASKKYSPEEVTRNVLHEVGHNAEPQAIAQVRGEWESLARSELSAAPKLPEMQEAYTLNKKDSKRAQREFFAQAYTEYVDRPEVLRKKHPKVYEFLRRKVFRGVEY